MPAAGEPLWTDEDRAWAIALLDVEADTCPDCGQPRTEATAATAEFQYDAELLRCHGCVGAAIHVKQHQDGGGDMRGLQVHVTHRG